MAKYFKERDNKLYRFLDRYAGIPLVSAAGLLWRRGVEIHSDVRRIALLKTACIGDSVLIDGISKDLRRAWPQAQQVFFAGRDNCQLAEMLQGIDEVVVLPMHSPWKAAQKIYESGRFDLWLDFSQWARIDALLTFCGKAARKIGFMTAGQHRHYGYDICIEHRNDVHELENYRNLIRAVGVKPEALPGLDGNFNTLDAADFAPNTPYVVFHMFPGGSRAYMKEWPEEQWLQVAHFCLSRGWALVLTGGPGDAGRAQVFIDRMNGVVPAVNLAGYVRLQQLPKLLSGAKMVISVNTGIMHVAAAVGANLIAIHGPTSPLRWGPLNPKAAIIKPENMDCAPCLHLGFEYKCQENNCLRNIPAQAVIDAIRLKSI
jgi:ADP-heptose:LPS heptosyltransferase